MGKHIFEDGPMKGHAAGDTSIEQQASQLVSDIKYKVRKKMKGAAGSNLSPAQVQGEYRKLFNASGASGAVKAIAKKKLFGEQIDYGIVPVAEHLESSRSDVFSRIFEGADGKFVVKVVDKATGNTSYRKADRAKIAELRANKNIASVEITGRKEPDDAYKGDPKPNYDGKKAKKDYDGDGKVESGSKEHAGAVHNAIQRKKGGVADGQDTRKEEYLDEDSRRMSNKQHTKRVRSNIKSFGSNYTPPNNYDPDANRGQGEVLTRKQMEKKRRKALRSEEVIYEKEEGGSKKLDVMKGKNKVNVNPTIGESIRAELAALSAEKIQEQESAMKQQEDEKKKEALANQQAKKDKMMKLRILQNKMRAVRGGAEISASHEMQGDTIAEGEGQVRYCPKCDKDETREECKYGGEYWDENSKPKKDMDPREVPTRINLAKNKLRAMGLKMSYDMEGDNVEEGLTDLQRRRYLGRKPGEEKERLKRANDRKDKKAALAAMEKQYKGMKAGIYSSYEPEGDEIDEVTYPSDFKKGSGVAKKKYGRPQQHDQETDRSGRRKTVDESAEDRLRDQRMERGGVDGNQRYDRAPKAPNTKKFGTGKTAVQKELEKKHGKGASAMDIVKAEIRAKHGKGAIKD